MAVLTPPYLAKSCILSFAGNVPISSVRYRFRNLDYAALSPKVIARLWISDTGSTPLSAGHGK
jgi:hypothetical protein